MHSLATIAERLKYSGRDRERSVRRLFAQLGVPMIRRGRGGWFVTDQQYEQLIEKMTCLPSDAEARTSTSAVLSVSGGRRVSSKSILAERITEKMQTRIVRSSKPKSAMKSFTVVEGGRTAPVSSLDDLSKRPVVSTYGFLCKPDSVTLSQQAPAVPPG